MAGTANYKNPFNKFRINKTLPVRERNEVICEQSRRVVAVPVVVEPVVVPIPHPVVEIQIADIEIAIRVAVAYRMPSLPPPLEYSRSCIAFGIVMP